MAIENQQCETDKCCEKCDVLQKEIENLKLKLLSANNMVKILRNEKRRIDKKIERKFKRDILLKNSRASEVYKIKTKIHSLTQENTRLRKLTKYMRNVFSETQIDAIINN